MFVPEIPDFDAEEVRAGLTLAMNVGLPVQLEDRPTFVFPSEITDTGIARDLEGVPFDWKGDRTPTGPDTTYQVPCGIEYIDDTGKVEAFGQMSPSRVILSILDEDYALIEGFSYVVIGGVKYHYQRTEPPIGLVSVGVYQVHCRADDEG